MENSVLQIREGSSGQKPEKVAHLTRQNKWETWGHVGSLISIDPSNLLVGTPPLKVIWNTDGDECLYYGGVCILTEKNIGRGLVELFWTKWIVCNRETSILRARRVWLLTQWLSQLLAASGIWWGTPIWSLSLQNNTALKLMQKWRVLMFVTQNGKGKVMSAYKPGGPSGWHFIPVSVAWSD